MKVLQLNLDLSPGRRLLCRILDLTGTAATRAAIESRLTKPDAD